MKIQLILNIYVLYNIVYKMHYDFHYYKNKDKYYFCVYDLRKAVVIAFQMSLKL